MGSSAKSALRERVRAARRQGQPADPHALARQCLSWLDSLDGPKRVTCYASYGTEPDTGPLLSALAEAGYEVLLPRVAGSDLEWVPAGAAMTRSTMGIDEPAGDAVLLLPLRAMLVPALAASSDGTRLGKGGGFYDRALSGIDPQQRPMVAAIVRDDDVLPASAIPVEDHDVRVDVVVTPSRVIRCTN